MKKYYSVRIKVSVTDDNGKTKKHSEEYVVEAVSVTDAEISLTKFFEGTVNFDYEVSSVRETKIVDIIKS